MSAGSATITPYRNGPYVVRGDFTLLDQDGNEVEVRRRTIALCRCGRSRIRPFCDGTHQLTNFRAESAPESAGWDGEPPAELAPGGGLEPPVERPQRGAVAPPPRHPEPPSA